jgi:phospholipase/lecithinase/hemolysin
MSSSQSVIGFIKSIGIGCLALGARIDTGLAHNAQRYDALYVFGDSYSDIGARYVDGNGPTAVAYLAQRMGIERPRPADST